MGESSTLEAEEKEEEKEMGERKNCKKEEAGNIRNRSRETMLC